MKKILFLFALLIVTARGLAQQDTVQLPADSAWLPPSADSALRIIDLNPYFTLHIDSTLEYQMHINKDPQQYYWYLSKAPAGLRINRETGLVTFKADRKLFSPNRLNKELKFKVALGVQNLSDPRDKIDTAFVIEVFDTDVIPSRIRPTVSSNMAVEEGNPVVFRVICENGSFPIENIITQTSSPLYNFSLVQQCGDEFKWTPPYDFVKDTDPGKEKSVTLQFIGYTKTQNRDTSTVKIIVKDALNYPQAVAEYNQAVANISRYILELKYTFLMLDRKLKKTKGMRTTFDLTSATTSLTGTIMSTSSNEDAQRNGKILPSVGLALVPIKEASVPNRNVDQNQAQLIRTSIKRLDYMRTDNQLVGERDYDIVKKTQKLKEELKQVQVQLIEVPMEFNNGDLSEEQLNRYFNSKKVRKKYTLSGK